MSMKTNFCLLLGLALTCWSFAQTGPSAFEAPDYVKIKNEITDSGAVSYYPRLMERLKQYDTTLTVADYRLLYYGFLFQPGSSDLRIPEQERELMPYYQSAQILPEQYDEIIELISQILETDPFYIRGLNFLGYVLHLKGEEDLAVRTSIRFGRTVNAILSTGDGLSPQTAFHVISPAHEYVVLNFLQLRYKNQNTLWIDGNVCDNFSLNKKQHIYFCVPYAIMKTQQNNTGL